MTISEKGIVMLISVLFSGVFGMASRANSDNVGDVRINDVSFYIPEGNLVCISGNVEVTGSGRFLNLGTVWFANTNAVQLSFLPSNPGFGKFIFGGSADCDLLNNVSWSYVSMQTSGGSNLLLDADMSIAQSLDLGSGIIDVGQAKLMFSSNSPDSLKFSNIQTNSSYISGAFYRAVSAGETYWFPVGDAYGFHPFVVQSATDNDTVKVTYDPDVSQDWTNMLSTDVNFYLEDIGGWNVTAETKFIPGISLLNKKQQLMPEGSTYTMLYAADETFFASGYTWDKLSVETDLFYLLNSEEYTGGIYALASRNAIRLVNFIYDNGTGDSFFEIPEISKYSQVELSVYNRWGSVIYKNNNYYNDFDAADFPEGTYFYDLKLHDGEATKLVRNIIEIKRAKN